MRIFLIEIDGQFHYSIINGMRLRRKLTVAAALLLLAATGGATAAQPKSGEDYAKDEKELRARLIATEAAQGPDGDDTLGIMAHLGVCLASQRKYTEAEAVMRTVVTRREKTQPDGSPYRAHAYAMLASMLTDTDKFDEALDLYERAHKDLSRKRVR